jgi:hypothetical protein
MKKSRNYRKEYAARKEAVRNEAIEWQYSFDDHNYSHGEVLGWMTYFNRLGRRYGLLREFRENGIC